jgi:hypothetical protein
MMDSNESNIKLDILIKQATHCINGSTLYAKFNQNHKLQ